jgi:hypothetical protein
MRYLPTLVLAIWLCFSSALAQFNPSTLEPPLDPFNGRTTLIPNTEIVPVEPIINIIQPIQQIFDQACGAIQSVGGAVSSQLAFLCTARDIVNDAVGVISSLNQDLSGYANCIAGGLLDGAVTAFGDTLGLSQVNAGLQNLRGILGNTVGQAREALETSINNLYQQSVKNLFAFDQTRPASDPRNLGALARMMNPEAAVAAVQTENQQKHLLELQGNSVITLNQARVNAAKLITNHSATDLNLLVNTPITGLASRLNARVGAAVSSREAIQRMTEGIADVMSVLATSNSQVTAHIAALAEQNVYTLQELQSLVQVETAKELAQLEAGQRAAETAMLNAWEEVQGMNALANSAARGLYGIGNDAPKGLGVLP